MSAAVLVLNTNSTVTFVPELGRNAQPGEQVLLTQSIPLGFVPCAATDHLGGQ